MSEQLHHDHAQIVQAHLSRLEDGRREAGLRVLERIANALGVDVVELFRR